MLQVPCVTMYPMLPLGGAFLGVEQNWARPPQFCTGNFPDPAILRGLSPNLGPGQVWPDPQGQSGPGSISDTKMRTKARDIRNEGSIVALKKVRLPLNEDGVPLSTLREISLLKQLEKFQHPNIVR